MTNTKTVSEQTIHGEVEYEVLECDSCGEEMLEEDANEFTIGDREGVACDYCVEEGPAGFPDFELDMDTGKAAIFTLLWPIAAIANIDNLLDGDGVAYLYYSAIAGISLYAVVLWLVMSL